jgi:hypothetical protein
MTDGTNAPSTTNGYTPTGAAGPIPVTGADVTAAVKALPAGAKALVMTSAVPDLPDAETAGVAATALNALSDNATADVVNSAVRTLPTEAKAGVAKAAVQSLPAEERDKMVQDLKPDQKVTNYIWLCIVTTFAIVLGGAMIALVAAVFLSPSRNIDQAQVQMLLTVFTTTAGILTGFVSGRASRS